MKENLEFFARSKDPVLAYAAARAAGLADSESYRPSMLMDPRIQSLAVELKGWPGPALSSHKSSSQFFHKLSFLADAGLTLDDAGMREIVDRVLADTDKNGIPCLGMEISEARGGSGKVSGWALCDAPVTLRALYLLGLRDGRVERAAANLAGLARPYGFSCGVSESLGNWRGPGKKTDPCPYATLVMMKLLNCLDGEYTGIVRDCAAGLLDLWEYSLTRHPYIFYMGTDFRKLKMPLFWYDILHVAVAIAETGFFNQDPRLMEMRDVIVKARGPEGFVPASVYLPWKDWDFGQKKKPSEWLGFQVSRLDSLLKSLN